MKGVILRIEPRAKIVDVTHDIASGDLHSAEFAISTSYRFFPKQAIHVVVVDPGVGGNREAIVVQTSDYFFVGPNNGVLSWALANENIQAIRSLENENYFLKPLSRTFHGRDIFAPMAAHLSRGTRVEKLGPSLKSIVRLDWPEPKRTRNGLQGAVIYLDRFGNAITNLDTTSVRDLGRGIHVIVRG